MSQTVIAFVIEADGRQGRRQVQVSRCSGQSASDVLSALNAEHSLAIRLDNEGAASRFQSTWGFAPDRFRGACLD